MAKKILSFLCALAVLVSMTVVGMVASSADGGSTTIDLLDSANLAKWTLTRSCPNTWTLANFAGVVDMSTLTPAPEGIGEYSYKDIVIPHAIPAIVSEDIFNRVAVRMGQNKHATGKAKAPDRYILTTKLFCGTCNSMFVGDSANKPNGVIYRYYKCASAKRHECDRKAIRKDWIEDKVIE